MVASRLLDTSEEKWIGITVTVRDDIENHADPCTQVKIIGDKLLWIAKKEWRIFKLFPEFTFNGRIHYHGWYKPKSKVSHQRAMIRLRKHIGFIKTENNFLSFQNWVDYCQKDTLDVEELTGLHHNRLLLTEDSVYFRQQYAIDFYLKHPDPDDPVYDL